MQQLTSSVGPNGQIALPTAIRERLGLKEQDRVAFHIDGEDVTLTVVRQRRPTSFQAVPALHPPRTMAEMIEIAREEHVHHVANEGRFSADGAKWSVMEFVDTNVSIRYVA